MKKDQYHRFEKLEALLESLILFNYSNNATLLGPILSGSLALNEIPNCFQLWKKLLKEDSDKVNFLQFLGPFLESIFAALMCYAEMSDLSTGKDSHKTITAFTCLNLVMIMRSLIDLSQKKFLRLPSGLSLLLSMGKGTFDSRALITAGTFRLLASLSRRMDDQLNSPKTVKLKV